MITNGNFVSPIICGNWSFAIFCNNMFDSKIKPAQRRNHRFVFWLWTWCRKVIVHCKFLGWGHTHYDGSWQKRNNFKQVNETEAIARCRLSAFFSPVIKCTCLIIKVSFENYSLTSKMSLKLNLSLRYRRAAAL